MFRIPFAASRRHMFIVHSVSLSEYMLMKELSDMLWSFMITTYPNMIFGT